MLISKSGLIPNIALDVGVVSTEDTYYIYIAAVEAGWDRSKRDIHLNLLDICNCMDLLLTGSYVGWAFKEILKDIIDLRYNPEPGNPAPASNVKSS